MNNQPTHCFLKISRFDSTAIQAVYPGVTTLQLEPGPIEGWIRTAAIDQLQVNAGSLSRAALYEGTYTEGKINVGFILDPDSTAVVQGHEYEAGTVSIDVGEAPTHEAFPGHLVWVGINIPESLLLKELKAGHVTTLRANPHLTLKGPREDLEPLIRLTHVCLNQKPSLRSAEAKRLSARFLSAIRDLVSARLANSFHELPYSEGDRFLMHLVKVSHQLSKERNHQALSLGEICTATGMKSRTLQKYFKNLYGMGPTEYFRTRRLNGVRIDLMKAGAGTSRVGEIAERWGFNHQGRFSLRYRHLFAESPSATLNRSPT